VASEGFHEPVELLTPEVIERHRAITSLMEELEAVDWYDQRVSATTDEELKSVLAHNRDEEKEHAAMTLEWLRRHDPKWDEMLRTYLFTDEPIVQVEEEAESQDASGNGNRRALAIGNLRQEPER
jgi:ferritin-like protein